MRRIAIGGLLVPVMLACAPAQAGFGDWLQKADEMVGGFGQSVAGQGQKPDITAALDDSEIISGLREALAQGVESAVNTLARKGGFLDAEDVRIMMPGSLSAIEQPVRRYGGGALIDQFITTMNRAAEEAVPDTARILGNAVRDMSVADARGILQGGDNAATDYFQRVSTDELRELIMPAIRRATEASGVTSAYKQMVAQAGPMLSMFGGEQSMDLDGYVADKTLDGLFTRIGQEEARIRANPLDQGSDILRRVFSSVR